MENTLMGSLSKVVLAGIGALGLTAEKSKELFDQLVQKGELTVEQAKSINEELKHNRAAAAATGAAPAGANGAEVTVKPGFEAFLQGLDELSPAQVAALKAKLDALGD